MNPNNKIKPRYEVTTYDGQTITTKTMTQEQVTGIKPQAVDHFLSSVFGIWGLRTADDKWVEHRGADWRGLGDSCIRIIQALQLNPGQFLAPAMIAELTGRSSFRDNSVLSARLMAIRKAHQESNKKPHFFLSRRAGGFGISWNPQLSWMSIERI